VYACRYADDSTTDRRTAHSRVIAHSSRFSASATALRAMASAARAARISSRAVGARNTWRSMAPWGNTGDAANGLATGLGARGCGRPPAGGQLKIALRSAGGACAGAACADAADCLRLREDRRGGMLTLDVVGSGGEWGNGRGCGLWTARTNSQRDRNVRQSSLPRSPRAVQHTAPRGVTLKTERAQSVHTHGAPNGVTHSATATQHHPVHARSAHHTPMSSDSEDSDSARSHNTDGAAAVSTHGTAAQRHRAERAAHRAQRATTLTAPIALCE